MSTTNDKSWTAGELAARWGYGSASSIGRVMRRYGIAGRKFGDAQQCARRFSTTEVELVERLAGMASNWDQKTSDARSVDDAAGRIRGVPLPIQCALTRPTSPSPGTLRPH